MARLLLETGEALLQESSDFVLLDSLLDSIAEVRLDFALGGYWLDVLTDSNNVVSVWPLRHIAETSPLRDRAFRRNKGTYEGTGLTRGVSMGWPGGGLGVTFGGTGHVVVPDDGADGYQIGQEGARTLSLAGDAVGIVVILQTTRNDSTRRAIVQKMTVDESGDGWSVSLIDGGIEFAVKNSAAQKFKFTRGAIDDGEIHVINCVLNPFTDTASILIDGVRAGVAVANVSLTPEYQATDLRIGQFADGSGQLEDTTIFAVMVGRDAGTDVGQALVASSAWTDVTVDMRSTHPVAINSGIGAGIDQHIAGVGTLSWSMDNGLRGTQGRYSLGHADVTDGFGLGMPVRLRLLTSAATYTWPMRLSRADPTPGSYRNKLVTCEAVDWFRSATKSTITSSVLQVNKTSDEAWAALVDEVDEIPVGISRDSGLSTFPFALDSKLGSKTLEAMARVMGSESGYCFISPDSNNGGELTFQSRAVRQIATAPVASFRNTMHGMAVENTEANVVNVVYASMTPRVVGAADNDTLWDTPSRLRLGVSEEIEVEGEYRDPQLKTSRIGGGDFHSLVAGDDYSMTVNADGFGGDLTSNLHVDSEAGANAVRFRIRNTGASVGYVYLRQRGRVLRTDEAQTIVVRNELSVRRHGPHELKRDYAFLTTPDTVAALAEQAVNTFAAGLPVPTTIQIKASVSPELLEAALVSVVGKPVAIEEPVSGTDGVYWVHGVSITVRPPEWVTVDLAVWVSVGGSIGAGSVPGGTTNFWVLGEIGRSEIGSCYVAT